MDIGVSRFDFVMPTVRTTDKRFGEETCPTPAKRPMNGFMLFAQKYRLQLIQQFPGRDNRYILIFDNFILLINPNHLYSFDSVDLLNILVIQC